MKVVEKRHAVFSRRGRGCTDQVLTLLLLGQTMMTRGKKGMSAAFMDFKKVHI